MGAGEQAAEPSMRDGASITANFEIYGAVTEEDLRIVQEMGFTQVILDRLNLAAPADAMGLGVVLANFWERTTVWSQIEFVLKIAASLKRLVSINMMDEPNDNGLANHTPDVYRRIRRQIRAAGFHDPLSLTLYGPKLDWPASWSWMFRDYLEAIDLLRIDPYPFVARKRLDLVARWIEQAATLSRPDGRERPLTVVLQAWAGDNGLPTIPMIRVMAYLALFSGVQTLSFFEYNPSEWGKVPGFTEEFRTLIRELTALAREFAGAGVVGVLGEDGLFQAEVQSWGQAICFTINTLDQPNGRLGPLQIVRESGHCARPRSDSVAPSSPRARLQGLRPPVRD